MLGSLLIGVFASEDVNPGSGANGLVTGAGVALLGKQARPRAARIALCQPCDPPPKRPKDAASNPCGALCIPQALGVAVVALYSAAVTGGLCVLLLRYVGLRVRLEDEMRGLDLADHDEVAYEWLQPPDVAA